MRRVFPNHRVVHAETPQDFKEHSVDDALAILSGKSSSNEHIASKVKSSAESLEVKADSEKSAAEAKAAAEAAAKAEAEAAAAAAAEADTAATSESDAEA